MAQRYFNDDLMAALDTLLPTNNNEQITAATMRDVLRSVIMSLRPTSVYYSRVGAALPIALTTTPQKILIFDSVQQGDITELEGTVGSNRLTIRNENGLVEMNAEFEVEGANSREVTFHLYKNGVATGQTTTANLEGAGNPVVISAQAKDIPLVVNDYYEVWASVDANDTVTFNAGSNWFARLISSRNPA